MRDRRGRLEGGPRDGATIAPGTRPTFIYVVGDEKKPRVFADPQAGGDLYRCIEVRDGKPHFIYAGDTHRKCGGCGAFVTTRPKCSFCGHREQKAKTASR
jgi:hypothetical protein